MELRRRAAAIAAVFALLAVAGAGIVAHVRPSPATLTDATGSPSLVPSDAPTRQRVERTLASVPIPPDAVRLATYPVAQLARPPIVPANANLIGRVGFWGAPGTVDAAIAWFETHRPPGMIVGARGGGPVERYLFEAGTTLTDEPWVVIAVAATGIGVAIRVDAMAVSTPTGPPRAYIGPVDSVEITVDRLNVLMDLRLRAPTVHRTLTGAPAQRLADAVDALAPDASGHPFCLYETGASDHLIFHTGSGRVVTVVESVGGCHGVQVTVGGTSTPLSGSVDGQLMAELGLPANYGS